MTTRPRALLALTAVLLATLPLSRCCPRPAPRTTGCAPSRRRSGPTSCWSSSTTSRWTCCRRCAAPGRCARGARRTRTRSSSTRLCCVSRASTFTGQYPHQTGVRTNVADPTDPADPRGGYTAFARFGNRERTVAVRLQAAGYTTGYVGKYLNQYEYSPGSGLPPTPPGWSDWRVVFGSAYDGWEFYSTLTLDGKPVLRYHPAPPASAPSATKDARVRRHRHRRRRPGVHRRARGRGGAVLPPGRALCAPRAGPRRPALRRRPGLPAGLP